MPPKASKAEMKSDKRYMSLSQVTDLMQQQKDTFMALLHQQRDNVKSFVQIIVDSSNSSDSIAISREIQEVKVSLQFTQKEVDDVKADSRKQVERWNNAGRYL